MIRSSQTLVLVWALLLGATTAFGTEEWTLEGLLAMRKLVVEEHVSFTQERHSVLFEEPLVSRGEFYYRAPALLEQTITAPYPSFVRLDGDEMTIERDGEKRHASLRQHPDLARQATALRGVLSGDLGALERTFSLALRGSRAAWSLQLTPHADASAGGGRDSVASNAQIEIQGSNERIERIDVQHSLGERTLITIDVTGSLSAPATGVTR